jgi:hypothetical protein
MMARKLPDAALPPLPPSADFVGSRFEDSPTTAS